MQELIVSPSVDQVMAFLCGLTCDYGDDPTLEEAEIYARRSSSLVSPGMAIDILGVKKWDEVLKIYRRYISGRPVRLGMESTSKKRNSNRRMYSYEELVDILIELDKEFDGQFSQENLRERAKRTPTPSYTTFSKVLGPMKNWPRIVAEAKAKDSTPNHIAH